MTWPDPSPRSPAPARSRCGTIRGRARVEPSSAIVEIRFGGERVARSTAAVRVLETSHPPTYYLPIQDFAPGTLRPALGFTYCEWKGAAAYFDVVAGDAVASNAAWTYPRPAVGFELLLDHVAVYRGR